MPLLDKLRQYYRLKKIVGASLRFGASGELYVHSCSINLNSDAIDIVELKNYRDLSKFIENIPKDIPISLHLEGSGILIKEVEKPEHADWEESYVTDVFPNYDPQLYYHVFMDSGKRFYIALARREKLDDIISEIRAGGISIAQVFIGPFIADCILEQLNTYSLSYKFSGHAIDLDENRDWTSYAYGSANHSKFNTKIGDTLIDQSYIISYATGFSTLMREYLPDYSVPLSEIEIDYREELGRIRFKNNCIVSLAFFFVLLLISSLLYSYYFSKNERLQAMNVQSSSTIATAQELQENIAQKEGILKRIGWIGGDDKSWLMDQIGISLNEFQAISITELAINPPKNKRLTSTGDEQDKRNTIVIKGRCLSLEVLNSWTRKLFHLNWVDRVAIKQFIKSQDYKDDQQVFEVEILFRYDF